MVPSPILRILLTGFMGAGKTTIGSLLALRLGWQFFDSDEELIRIKGVSIAVLFDQLGEVGFRGLEEQAVAGLLDLDQAVIALGGGALESEVTRARLLSSAGTHIVYLETPLNVALARCARQAGAAVRPLLREQAFLAERFHRRLDHYRQAHQTVSTAERSPKELVGELLGGLAGLERDRHHLETF